MDKRLPVKKLKIATESHDKSTNNVLEWLHFYGQSVTRHNVDTDCLPFSISLNDNHFTTSLTDYVIWNRRGYLPLIPYDVRNSYWGEYLKKEQLPVLSFIESMHAKNYKGSYIEEYYNNKIKNLQLALESGIEIPRTLITNNRTAVLEFIDQEKQYITKCIYHEANINHQDVNYSGIGTVILDTTHLPQFFAPSLVQECISKDVELRIFYFDDLFYAMAIFSQQDEKTKVDFRNYNHQKPNRTDPFLLPDDLVQKLKKFTKITKSNTGSIDIILTTEGRFVFLEVNPMGQYDWLSESCNYYIDKDIAQQLANHAGN